MKSKAIPSLVVAVVLVNLATILILWEKTHRLAPGTVPGVGRIHDWRKAWELQWTSDHPNGYRLSLS